MKLISNECVNCRRPVGYVAPGTLLLPTFCVLCAGDKEVLKEWGHTIDKKEKSLPKVLSDYRITIQYMEIK